jgi:transposase
VSTIKNKRTPHDTLSNCQQGLAVFQLPTSCAPIMMPSSMSVSRDKPLQMTVLPGGGSLVARAHGVNANQVFKWRRALKRGELNEPSAASTALLPVTLSSACEAAIDTGEVGAKGRPTCGGAIHIEFPGRALISVESGADAVLVRSILESLRK